MRRFTLLLLAGLGATSAAWSSAVAEQATTQRSKDSREERRRSDQEIAASDLEALRKSVAILEEDVKKSQGELVSAEKLRQDAKDELALVAQLMEVFLAVIGVIVALSAGAAFLEGRRLRNLRKEAEEIVGQARTAAAKAVEDSRRIAEVVANVMAEVDRAEPIFNELPSLLTLPVALGAPPAVLPPRVEQALEDADILLGLYDRLKLPGDAQKSAERFLKLGLYRAARREYGRAIARLERATELDPSSAEAHLELGRILSYHAAESGLEGEDKKSVLQQAEFEVGKAVALRGGSHDADTLHVLAWVCHDGGKHERAAELYEEAWTKSDGQGWEIKYNRSCALAALGRGDEALADLGLIPKGHRAWRVAEEDEELKALRVAPWRARFMSLVDERKPT